MLCNQKFCDLPGVVKDSSTDHYLAAFIVTNSNFTDVILKFLSNTSTTGTVVVSGQAQNQVSGTKTSRKRVNSTKPGECY